jgi:hypothetical protein
VARLPLGKVIGRGYAAGRIIINYTSSADSLITTTRAWPGPARLRGFQMHLHNWNFDAQALPFVSTRFIPYRELPLRQALALVEQPGISFAAGYVGLIPLGPPLLWDMAELRLPLFLDVRWPAIYYGVVVHIPSLASYRGYGIWWAEEL